MKWKSIMYGAKQSLLKLLDLKKNVEVKRYKKNYINTVEEEECVVDRASRWVII